MASVNYQNSLAALSQLMQGTSQSERDTAKSRFDLSGDIYDEQVALNKEIQDNERAKKKTRRRQGGARTLSILGALAASLASGGTMSPLLVAAIAGGGSALGQGLTRNYSFSTKGIKRGSKPSSLGDGKFFNEQRNEYDRNLGDWRKDLTTDQFTGAATDAFSAYNATNLLKGQGVNSFKNLFDKLQLPQGINPMGGMPVNNQGWMRG